MKKLRLDQVLKGLGYVSEEQITRAMERQEREGGRFGTNLIEGGDLTEAQLAEALAAQFDLPWVATVERDIAQELLAEMPTDAVIDHLTLPLEWDPGSGTLRLVVADPTDHESIRRAKEAFGAERVSVVLAPESVLREKVGRLAGPALPAAANPAEPVELPELFRLEREAVGKNDDAPASRRSVLVVTAAASHRNFLPPIFDREGCSLIVVSTPEDAQLALTDRAFDSVLVSEEMASTFRGWIKAGLIRPPDSAVTVFTSVASESLLENPAPYAATFRSLMTAVQALSETRWSGGNEVPAQGLVADDLAALAKRYGLGRLAQDGLQLAAHILTPNRPDANTPGKPGEPFLDFPESLDLAGRLRFPFRLDHLLAESYGLYQGTTEPGDDGPEREEVRLAAQMLALVWFRHNQIRLDEEADAALMSVLHAAVRRQAGRLATPELVEVYLRMLTERGDASALLEDREILLVGGERLATSLGARLGRVGCRTVVTDNLVEARTLIEGGAPAAVVIDGERFGEHAVRFARIARLDGEFLLYAVTDSGDPATTLSFLDAEADDVFAPPHDFDLTAARITRAVRTRSKRQSKGRARGFSASFAVFSFLDLVQALGQAHKTVRIELSGGASERGEVFLHDGVMEHAECGDLSGTEAVYRVIAWEDDGEFTVHPGETARLRTIHDSTGAVLMEGCRRLDESKI